MMWCEDSTREAAPGRIRRLAARLVLWAAHRAACTIWTFTGPAPKMYVLSLTGSALQQHDWQIQQDCRYLNLGFMFMQL